MPQRAYTVVYADDIVEFTVTDELGESIDRFATEEGEWGLGDEFPGRKLGRLIQHLQKDGAITGDPRVRIVLDHADEAEGSWVRTSVDHVHEDDPDAESPIEPISRDLWDMLGECVDEGLEMEQLPALVGEIVELANTYLRPRE